MLTLHVKTLIDVNCPKGDYSLSTKGAVFEIIVLGNTTEVAQKLPMQYT